MATTIQVKETTLELLKRVRKNTNASSYDEAINKLAKKVMNKSMAGTLARKKHYSKDEILRGLRDERDRI
ncbi:MAG: hypothetical protein AABW85_05450 [archaeon]